MNISNFARPNTLLQAANHALGVYAVAAVLSLLAIVFAPSWIRWLWFAISGVVLLVSILANFVEDWVPKSRVPINSKAVVITGCDSGFGYQLAQKLDDLGLQVFAGCLYPEGQGAQNLKMSATDKMQVLPLDVTSAESVENFRKEVVHEIKNNELWAVVCNAGINDGGEIFWTNTDIMQRVMEVNTFGVVRVTKAFLPQLCKSKGRVVTVISAASLHTFGGFVPYCMSKSAAKSFCDGLRLEMYRFGVKVVTVSPWMYKTNFTKEELVMKYAQKSWDEAPAEIKEFYPKDYFQYSQKIIVRILNYGISDKPQQVVDCLEEAVMALNPKYSYTPGTVFLRFGFWILSRLPTQFTDFVMHEEYHSKR